MAAETEWVTTALVDAMVSASTRFVVYGFVILVGVQLLRLIGRGHA